MTVLPAIEPAAASAGSGSVQSGNANADAKSSRPPTPSSPAADADVFRHRNLQTVGPRRRGAADTGAADDESGLAPAQRDERTKRRM